jgi:hypothetical protein
MRSDSEETRELTEDEAVSGGIIVVGGLGAGSWAMLNPQPLPPIAIASGPQPDPWLVAKQIANFF